MHPTLQNLCVATYFVARREIAIFNQFLQQFSCLEHGLLRWQLSDESFLKVIFFSSFVFLSSALSSELINSWDAFCISCLADRMLTSLTTAFARRWIEALLAWCRVSGSQTGAQTHPHSVNTFITLVVLLTLYLIESDELVLLMHSQLKSTITLMTLLLSSLFIDYLNAPH